MLSETFVSALFVLVVILQGSLKGVEANEFPTVMDTLSREERVLGIEGMGIVGSNTGRVRYDKEELFALRELAANSSAWNELLHNSGSVVQELFELDVEKAVPPVRKRNVDRRQRGVEKDSFPCSGVLVFDAKQKPRDLGYVPVVLGSDSSETLRNAGQPDLELVEVDDVYADSDSEEESLQPRAFAVYGEPNFEDGPPQDGLEYLRRVRWEAARYPKVKVAKINPKKFAAAQTRYIPQIPAVPACASELLPSKKWETAFLADFSDLRLRFAGMVAPPNLAPWHSWLPPVQNKEEVLPVEGDVKEDVLPVEGDADSFVEVSVGDSDDSVEEVTMKLKDAILLDCKSEPEVQLDGRNFGAEPTDSICGGSVVYEHQTWQSEERYFEPQDTRPGSDLHVVETDFGSEEKHIEASSELHLQNGEGMSDKTDGSDAEDTAPSGGGGDTELSNGVHEQTTDADVKGSAGDDAKGVNPACKAQTSKERKPILLPYAAVLLSLDEVSRAALFRHHVSWLKIVRGLPERQACWLFSLAAAVDKPLDADTSASFRELYRRCAEIRAAKSNCDDELVRLNMLITIAGRYFGQGEFAC